MGQATKPALGHPWRGPTALTPGLDMAQDAAAREWIQASFGLPAERMSFSQVERMIAHRYSGGLGQFKRDAADLEQAAGKLRKLLRKPLTIAEGG